MSYPLPHGRAELTDDQKAGFHAVKGGTSMQALLDSGVNANSTVNGRSLLVHALALGHSAVARVVVSAGASVEPRPLTIDCRLASLQSLVVMNVEQLRKWVAEGHCFDYLLFWGHRQKRKGSLDASCLSQWFPAPVVLDGVSYPTAEHWMMAGKARLFGDERILAQIIKASDPGKAKALGRRVSGFDEAIWSGARSQLVLEGNRAKFSQSEALKGFLLNTGRRILVEANPSDRIWGIGMGASNPDARNPVRWNGKNLLGFALMETRALLGGDQGAPRAGSVMGDV